MAKKVAKKQKRTQVKTVFFKIKGELQKLAVTVKDTKVGADGRVRLYLRAVNPDTGKLVSRQVSKELFDKVLPPK